MDTLKTYRRSGANYFSDTLRFAILYRKSKPKLNRFIKRAHASDREKELYREAVWMNKPKVRARVWSIESTLLFVFFIARGSKRFK